MDMQGCDIGNINSPIRIIFIIYKEKFVRLMMASWSLAETLKASWKTTKYKKKRNDYDENFDRKTTAKPSKQIL